MSLRQLAFSRQGEHLQAYLDGLTEAAGHADRRVPMENYTKGLMLPIERKGVEPMAARLAAGYLKNRLLTECRAYLIVVRPWNARSTKKPRCETEENGICK